MLSKRTCLSSQFLFLLHVFFHLQPDVFGHVYIIKTIQEEGEKRTGHSEGIWLVLIWKYCFTSSEPNYWSELIVLSPPAHSHCSADGQGVVRRSVTATTVCTWTPGFSTTLLLCSRSEALLCYCWTRYYTHRQCLKRNQTFFTLSSSVVFVLLVCIC